MPKELKTITDEIAKIQKDILRLTPDGPKKERLKKAIAISNGIEIACEAIVNHFATPPLVEAQKMIADFLCSVTHAELDLKRLSQLIEVGQQEIEIKRG